MHRFSLFSKLFKYKPRVLLLVDKPGWAFDHSAKQIVRQLKNDFHFDIRYVLKNPKIRFKDYDLIHVFFWGEKIYRKFGFPPERIIKEVSSHRWEDDPKYGPCTPVELCQKYLNDAGAVICTSLRLRDLIGENHPNVYHTPNGIDPLRFKNLRRRKGPLKIGWAGNILDPVKRFTDLIKPACKGQFELRIAPGNLSHRQMNNFYNEVDVIAVSSKHEGEPLTLLEAMAAGCFPVCVDVGIVSEMVQNGKNGIVVEPSTESFVEAFKWCKTNLDEVRRRGEENSEFVCRHRSWGLTATSFKQAYLASLDLATRPRFRNDDVSADTPFDQFEKFCNIFRKHGFVQIHGITLNGSISSRHLHEGLPVECAGNVSMGEMSNTRIRELSQGFRFEDRTDIINYLNESADKIALHGLYHTDYSVMTYEEQREDIAAGLDQLRRLFPKKQICYFIAPFNRTNADTYRACRDFSLAVSAAEGVHLESNLQCLEIRPGTWYRYHHHRFYPESTFNHYELSLEALDSALAKLALPNTNSYLRS